MKQAVARVLVVVCLVLAATTACHRDPAASEAKYLAKGKRLLDQKDYARAALEFSNAAKINPKRADTWYQIAIAYLNTNRAPEAVAALRRAVEIDPSHTDAQLKLSSLMVQSRDPETLEAAVTRLGNVLAAKADNPDALDLLAAAEMKLGQGDSAEKHLRQALEHFPGRLRSSAELAALQLNRKQFTEAEATLRDAVAKAPQSVDAAVALGQLYLFEKKLDAADAEFRRAIALDGNAATAWVRLAQVQVAQGKLDEAEKSYQKIASLPNAGLSYAHAAFAFEHGRVDEGIRELAQLAKAAPNDLGAQTRLVAANLHAGREAEAMRILNEILTRNPKNTNALLLRARLRLRQGKPLDAEADVQQVLHLTPDSADAHYILALVYQAAKRAQMREKELGEVVRLRPDALQARIELAQINIAAGHAEAALQTLEEAPRVQKTTIAHVVERNWALLALQRDGEAAQAIEAVLKTQSVPDLLLQRGVIAAKKHDYPAAIRDSAAAFQRDPTNTAALNLLMQGYAVTKQTATGIDVLRSAVKNSTSQRTQVLAGYWLGRFGKADEARIAFEAARKGKSGNSEADMAEALLDISQNNREAAKTRLNAVVASDMRNDSALLLLANLAYEAKDYTSALAHFKAVSDSNPQSVIAANGTAYLLANLDPTQALKYGEQALRLAPDNAMVQDTLGWIYYRQGAYTQAASYLQSSVAKEPTPVHQYHLGMAYLKMGDTVNGTRLLNAAMAKDPNIAKTEQAW